jgi:hypothetical protein
VKLRVEGSSQVPGSAVIVEPKLAVPESVGSEDTYGGKLVAMVEKAKNVCSP